VDLLSRIRERDPNFAMYISPLNFYAVKGATWVTAATLDATIDPNSVWNTVTVDISGASELMIRYRATLLSTRTAVSVDDVFVTAS